MWNLYLGCLVFGGGMVGFSLLFGGADLDADVDADLDAPAELDVDMDAGHGEFLEATEVAAVEAPFWLLNAFKSLWFWAFGTLAFGAVGALLTLASVAGPLVPVAAGLTGFGSGLGASKLFSWIKTDQVSGSTSLQRFEGLQAKVLLPIRPGGRGQVRMNTASGSVVMVATSMDGKVLDVGSQVLVVSVKEGVADVTALTSVS